MPENFQGRTFVTEWVPPMHILLENQLKLHIFYRGVFYIINTKHCLGKVIKTPTYFKRNF